jgi:hypothetical protein
MSRTAPAPHLPRRPGRPRLPRLRVFPRTRTPRGVSESPLPRTPRPHPYARRSVPCHPATGAPAKAHAVPRRKWLSSLSRDALPPLPLACLYKGSLLLLRAPARSRRCPNSPERWLQRWPPPGAAVHAAGRPSPPTQSTNRTLVDPSPSPRPSPAELW